MELVRIVGVTTPDGILLRAATSLTVPELVDLCRSQGNTLTFSARVKR